MSYRKLILDYDFANVNPATPREALECLELIMKMMHLRSRKIANIWAILERLADKCDDLVPFSKIIEDRMWYGAKDLKPIHDWVYQRQLTRAMPLVIGNESVEGLRALIDLGLDVNGYLLNGLTPLMAVIGNHEMVRCLLNAGADPLKKASDGVTTAILMAASNLDLASLRLLVA